MEKNFKQRIQAFETELIREVLKSTNGNCTQAAELLGINRTTLVEKRRRYGLELNPPCLQPKEKHEPDQT